jgi:leucyl-tRNA synthetase
MEYNFKAIEEKWQAEWKKSEVYKVETDPSKPKFYVLDMFPYPSGAGLHVGHPLGYIASDIYSRYKRLKGFNVLHPMGYDAFGLPAEQYAIQTGQHPAKTTKINADRYREQLDKIGFSYDWSREFKTSDPDYYKWTQWVFTKMFDHYYCNQAKQARPIAELKEAFAAVGTEGLDIACTEELVFTAEEWKNKSDKEQQEILLNYRLAYLAETFVNWCPALGTVLANDEITNGVSVRGGHPVEQKKMWQWSLRVSAYAERLLNDMESLEWTDALKEIQKNWIGKSTGATVSFGLSPALSRGEGALPEYQTANSVNWELNKENARNNRKGQTPAEEALWQELRAKQTGYHIRRQHVIGNFIADFVCLSKKLIIEVDGKYHETQKEEDQLRTEALNDYGFEVVRFTNEEVLADSKNIANKIKKLLDSKVLPAGEDIGGASIEVFTTRPDTIYGVTFMVLAPESELVNQLTTDDQKEEVTAYIKATQKRSERERMADVKTVSGVFSGSYAVHPFTGQEIPIWIADYVLAGYGTGAVMAVPAHDSRDFAFAKHFDLPILQVVSQKGEELSDPKTWEESYDSKEGICVNSELIDDLDVKDGMQKIIDALEEKGIGKKQINYRLRDAIFSRQRYWGEPFPVYYKDDMPYTLEESQLPLELPEVDKFLPTEDGQPPLGRAENWQTKDGFPLELSTMPGFAGSSAYYLRYMDPKNDKALVSKEANEYWQDVDLYIGGTEHATGHLIYSRFWNKFLFDIGEVVKNEPFKKLINQGMIQGRSNFVYRITGSQKFVSLNIKEQYDTEPIHVDVNIVSNDILDLEAFKQWRPEFENAEFILEDDGKYHCGYAVEKMSKSMFNVVNPDDIIEKYGADTLRMYEMFLGPLEQAKPWDTNGIDGVFKFFRKVWNLFYDQEGKLKVTDEKANKDELKVLHKTIQKIQHDIEHFSFNTSVSAFMIFANEIGSLKSNKREILEPFLVLLSSFAPHITEELWHALGNETSIIDATFPEFKEEFLKESEHEYPVSFNGKMRFKLKLSLDIKDPKQVEEIIKTHEAAQKWIEGKQIRKVIFVPKKIINIVIG